jgi:hypothetical protein
MVNNMGGTWHGWSPHRMPFQISQFKAPPSANRGVWTANPTMSELKIMSDRTP